jgi:hypothetical protein
MSLLRIRELFSLPVWAAIAGLAICGGAAYAVVFVLAPATMTSSHQIAVPAPVPPMESVRQFQNELTAQLDPPATAAGRSARVAALADLRRRAPALQARLASLDRPDLAPAERRPLEALGTILQADVWYISSWQRMAAQPGGISRANDLQLGRALKARVAAAVAACNC